MSDINTVKAQIQSLIDLANTTTGNQDTNLTDGVNALVSGFGQGGSGGSALPIAEESSFGGNATGGSKFYYNGVLLPEIPSELLEKYPNVAIIQWVSDGTYGLICAPDGHEWYYDYIYNQLRVPKCTIGYYGCKSVDEEWTFYYETEGYGLYSLETSTWIWSLRDIMLHEGGTTVYFEGSEPISEFPQVETYYQIKESTLTSFADQARRISGETGYLTTTQMLTIFESVEV